MGQQKPPRAALLGGAGLVGRALARRLLKGAEFTPCIFDLNDPCLPGVEYRRVDALTDELTAVLQGMAVVFHLVAQVDPPRVGGRRAMRRLHEEGARNVGRAAVSAGVPRLVHCSSAVVYGAYPGRTLPLTEEAPLLPNPGFPYAVDKAAQEQILQGFRGAIELCIARPAIIYSHEARSYLTEILRYAPGILPAINGQRPALQFVHVDDVAEALVRLARSEFPASYNVCPPDWVSYEEVARIAGLRVVDVPRRVLAPLLDAAALLAPRALRAPSYILDYLSYPFVMSPERFIEVHGVRAQHSTQDALREMLAARPPHRLYSRR